MYKHALSTVCGYLLSMGLFAQTLDIKQVLSQIEENNLELIAYQSLIESKRIEYKTFNNLPDPVAAFYVLPWGTHSTGDYTEFEISQSFEFPSVYGTRNRLIERQYQQTQLEYDQLRQQILLTSEKNCLDLNFLNGKKQLEEERFVQAKNLFDQVQQLFDKEQVGLLELNKAKIAWMQEQFAIQQVEMEINNKLLSLQNLNGGQAISLNQVIYTHSRPLTDFDSLWREKIDQDPELNLLKSQEQISLQNIRLQKSKSLPNMNAGFSYQGVRGEVYTGAFGGISIPLWENRNKIKTANLQYQYTQHRTLAVTRDAYTDYLAQYNQYTLMLMKFQEYQSTLEKLNSEFLLLQAYNLGEISFADYYSELKFYRDAYDRMLLMENQLLQLKAELLKHQL